ncbi:MAG: DUF4249 domain-containing protein [Gemmatimonadetes bacterium]|nr:DUF4249 domain-containing protein [Gemmatimonadota bacterium]
MSRPHALGPRRPRTEIRRAGCRAALIGLLVALLPACELADVVTEPAEDILVVESVLSAAVDYQIVLLHRSIADRIVRGEPNADVRIIGPRGDEHTLVGAPLGLCADGLTPKQTDSLDVRASCYINPVRGPLNVSAGSAYELRVLTADGRQLRGRTTVPGHFQLRSLPAERTGIDCSLPPNTNFPLTWSVAEGAWGYLAAMEIQGLNTALRPRGIVAPPSLVLTGAAVSRSDTTLVIPADLGLFELGEANQGILKILQNGFPAGVSVYLTIAAADRNYVNAVRGGGFNPSGNVRISSVVGDGVGAFGSIFPRRLQIAVGEDLPFPPCLPA